MKDVREDELFRLSLKPELTPEEQGRLQELLATLPERVAWEEDRALGRALQSLPDVPVSSNFTARVMQELDLEETRAEQTRRAPRRGWLAFWPRLAGAGVAAVLAVFVWRDHRASERTQLVRDASLISKDGASLPGAEVLRDFDAIDSLRHLPPSNDDGILIALQ
jgi:anti-sigma factor RsiW